MHNLTSSIFLPAYMSPLDVPHRRVVLKTYLMGVLATTIARGRPKIDVEYLMGSPLIAVGPGTTPSRGSGKDGLSDAGNSSTRNAWTSIVESSLYASGMSPATSIHGAGQF
jgi:hypothetical protein